MLIGVVVVGDSLCHCIFVLKIHSRTAKLKFNAITVFVFISKFLENIFSVYLLILETVVNIKDMFFLNI